MYTFSKNCIVPLKLPINKSEIIIIIKGTAKLNLFLKNHTSSLKKHFNISKKHIDSVYSKTPLEDILVEKASILL